MKSITAKILVFILVIVLTLSAGLVLDMTYFMNTMTDSILLDVLQPMAKIAAQSVEGNLHVLADRFFLIRDDSVLNAEDATLKEKEAALDNIISGIEFVWLGVYSTNGTLLVGSAECPRSLTGHKLYPMLRETENLCIEDTTVGNSGLEIVMGIPIMDTRPTEDGEDVESYAAYYLAGSYQYDVLGDMLSSINIGENDTAFIINENGRVIAHKDLGKVYSQQLIVDGIGGDADVQEAVTLMLHGQTGSASVMSAEGEMYMSYSPIRGTLWSLGILAPRSDFMEAVQQAVSMSMVITGIFLLLIILLVTVIIRRILTEPMRAITESARNLAVGKFDTALPPRLLKRKDEIGELGGAFTTMSSEVGSVIRDIEQLTAAAQAGSLGTRTDHAAHQGDYHLILASINATMDVVCGHLDAMPNAFGLFDARKLPIYMNEDLSELFARHSRYAGKEDLLKAIIASATPEGAAWEAEAIFGPDAKGGRMFSTDVSIPDDQGEMRNYAMSLRRIGDGAKGADGVCVMLILSDVTQLIHARTAAEAASRAKGDFLANMSHEMRTPMNAIIGMTAIAGATGDPERKDYCLKKINEASVHLLGVINDILDMSKIEANKFELSLVEFDFEKILQKVVNVISFRVEERRQSLTVFIDKRIPRRLIGDDQRISQVIANLLSNAVKFTPEGGNIRLSAKLNRLEEERCTLQIEVADTGIGISAEQKARLFASFEQAETGTSRKYGGTGLGLAISKNIVQMMGGEIWVDSTPGEGSTFAFTMTAGYAKQEEAKPLLSGIDWKDVRVLAVDDAPEIRMYFEEIAGQFGFALSTADSGDTACAMIEENGGYDVFFVDWKMPGMDGIELTRHIKKINPENSVVIMISATEWNLIETEAKAAGVDIFLPKPLFPSAIVDCINECFGVKATEALEEGKMEPGCFAGRRILLAEDVEINREIVLTLLEPTKIAIDCAENGAEAVRLFAARPEIYDLIFMDVQMPEMDGLEATRRIRGLDTQLAKRVPIVAMTANVFREDVDRCLDAGMNDHVGKPLNIEEVLEKLKAYLPPA